MKRFLIRLTAVSLLLCLLAGMVGAVPAGYDFPEDWSREALIFAVENGVFQGDQHGDLRPKASITRAEMAAVLVRLLGAEEQAEASAQLDGAISLWVNAVTEAYPELKANEQYRALQDELAGTENRVATARKDYNDAVKVYNAAVRRFPMNIFAGMFGFERAEFFEADDAAQSAPQVSFDD